MYFNYHAKAKRLIRQGELVSFEFVDKHNNISPALLLHFKNITMPIREHKFDEYLLLINEFSDTVND